MAEHLGHAERTRRWGALAVAAGLGLAVFAVVDGERGSETVPGYAASHLTSAPTVLGSIVTAMPSVALADPATPASFDLPRRTLTPTTHRSQPTRSSVLSATSTTAAEATTTTTPGPELIPPMTIENTTTTTEGTSTTTESPSTTEPTTTSTTASTEP